MSDEEEYEIQNEPIRAMLRDVGHTIGDQLPPGWGMCLLLFTFDGEETFYISNAERGSMIKMLQEFIREQKRRGH